MRIKPDMLKPGSIRRIEYIDDAGQRVFRTYREPEPSYLKLHDETGQPWHISVTTDGELRTTKIDIQDEYGELTLVSSGAFRLPAEQVNGNETP